MGDAMWIGPAVTGLVFGVFFGLAFPIVSRWMSGDQAVRQSAKAQFVTGLGSGVLFGFLLYIGNLIDAGSIGGGWIWFERAARIFGAICIMGGLAMIVLRLIRGR